MEIFKCKYEHHENEAIIGFCLNSKCQNTCQYCYKCLMKVHSDHHDDCIRFTDISNLIDQYIQFQGKIIRQSNEIYIQIKNQIESNIKRMNDNILTLKDLKQLLISQEYIKFKQSINIIKQYYSLEQQKKEEQCIKVNQLRYIEQINQMNSNKTQNKRKIRMKSNKKLTKHLKWQSNYFMINQFYDVTNEGQHEDALKLYDKSLSLFKIIDEIFRWESQSLNSNHSHLISYFIYKGSKKELNVVIWPYTQILKMTMPITTKDGHYRKIELYFNINTLTQYKEAIECCDQAIQLNPKNDSAYHNKGWALLKY